MNKLNTAPVPTAIEMATSTASAIFVIPDKISPAIVSLMAFVIVSPGTRSIIDPIIVLSRFAQILNFMKITASIAQSPPPSELMKKSFIFSFWQVTAIILIHAPIIHAEKKSFNPPPNIIAKQPAAIDEHINVVKVE